MFLNQLPMTMMLQMLTQNPSTGVYSFSTQDFPLGVPRSALLAVFSTLANAPSNFDAKGNWNTQASPSGLTMPSVHTPSQVK